MAKDRDDRIVRVKAPPPSIDPDELESQLVSMAYEYASKQMENGTISAAALTHFLKIGAERERNQYELQKLQAENALLKAKTEAIKEAQKLDEMYANAIAAMGSYHYDRNRSPDSEVQEEDV